jgi:hypothetical protein
MLLKLQCTQALALLVKPLPLRDHDCDHSPDQKVCRDFTFRNSGSVATTVFLIDEIAMTLDLRSRSFFDRRL